MGYFGEKYGAGEPSGCLLCGEYQCVCGFVGVGLGMGDPEVFFEQEGEVGVAAALFDASDGAFTDTDSVG